MISWLYRAKYRAPRRKHGLSGKNTSGRFAIEALENRTLLAATLAAPTLIDPVGPLRVDQNSYAVRGALKEVAKVNTTTNVAGEPEYLSIAEAARFLKLKESYVYHLKSTIPFYKPGTKVYFKKSDLIAYMESHKKEPNSKLNTSSSTHELFARPQRIRFSRSANKIKK